MDELLPAPILLNILYISGKIELGFCLEVESDEKYRPMIKT
jgi:hypothetical protein